MGLDHYSGAFHRFRNKLSLVVVPLQYAVSLPVDFVNWIVTDISSYHNLLKDNANLHSQNLFLQARLQKQVVIEAENKQLFALLQSKDKKTNEKMMEARLLAVAPDPFMRQIVINKGSNDKVFVGQPVLDVYGVMGQVIQAGPFTSRVLLLTDPKSAIPVQIQRNGIRAIAVGDASHDVLRLEHVTQIEDVREGDEIITSGLGERYPFGYPVGKIISIKNDPNSAFQTIYIKPKAHLNRSRLMLLVWPDKIKMSASIRQALNKTTQNSTRNNS